MQSSMLLGKGCRITDHMKNRHPEERLSRLYFRLPEQKRCIRFAKPERVARIIGLDENSVRFWIHSGAIRAVRIGNTYQIDLVSVQKYLRSQIREQMRAFWTTFTEFAMRIDHGNVSNGSHSRRTKASA